MMSTFHKIIIRRVARSRSDVRWLIRGVEAHAQARRTGVSFEARKTRTFRLALGQYFLTESVEHPYRTVLGPVMAIAIYIYIIADAVYRAVR